MNFTALKKKTAFHYYEKQLKKQKKVDKKTPEKINTIGVLADSRLFGSYDLSRNLSQKLNLPHKNLEIIISRFYLLI